MRTLPIVLILDIDAARMTSGNVARNYADGWHYETVDRVASISQPRGTSALRFHRLSVERDLEVMQWVRGRPKRPKITGPNLRWHHHDSSQVLLCLLVIASIKSVDFVRAIEQIIRRERFDVVVASWAHADSFGVMLMAKKRKFRFATVLLGRIHY